MSGCSSNSKTVPSCVTLPNGQILRSTSVHQSDSIIKLTYEHYRGFTGVTSDSVLTKFTVMFEDHAEKVGRDIAGDEHIRSLRKERIVGLRFEKIPESVMRYEQVVEYVSKQYPTLERKKNQNTSDTLIDEEIEFVNDKGELVAKVQHSKLGVSGTFVVLLSNECF
jgi:hypothetical protein